MTGILILSIAFAAIAVVGLVGLLASRIVSSMNRRKLERTRSRPAPPTRKARHERLRRTNLQTDIGTEED